VQRLEDLPANASYPSGHTAASIAVYAGLVLLLTSAIPNRKLRVAAWVAAVVLPIFVAMSRMYRGMHHPLDVAAGALIGVGAVLVLLFACRAAAAAVREPAASRSPVARRRRVQAAS
jgi:membrane-associated phospholipid phosphatase